MVTIKETKVLWWSNQVIVFLENRDCSSICWLNIRTRRFLLNRNFLVNVPWYRGETLFDEKFDKVLAPLLLFCSAMCFNNQEWRQTNLKEIMSL